MRKRLGVFCILVLLFAGKAEQSNAQFWKNWFKKEEPKRKPVQKPKPKEPVKDVAKPKKKQKVDYPATVIKDRYRVDILASLYLDELVVNNKPAFKDRIPDKALTGVNFYEGVKLAADSLTKLGYKLDVYIHDITQSALSPEALIKSDALLESDLIIGVLQYNQIKPIAAYAKKHNVNFVSALSPSDGDIKDNPFFTMMQPTLETHCKKIKELIRKKYPNDKLLLFYRTNTQVDSAAYAYLMTKEDDNIQKVLCNTFPQQQQLERFFDSTRVNIICMPIVDGTYVEGVLQDLHSWFPQYKFDVYGMPSWKSISSLKKADAYSNVAVNFSSPFYYDLSTPLVQSLTNAYRKEFGGRASELVYRGYETLFWYTNLLQRYGTIFNQKQNDNNGALFTRFDVKPQWNKDKDFLYNENEHIYLYKYEGGSYMVEP